MALSAKLFAALVLGSLASASLAQTPSDPAPVVMISIDGMKPEYITHADEHGLRVPVMRRFMREGVYADGVQGVIPTVTYPSHTTMVTGVWPAEHGVVDNTTFDPLREHPGQWYWDFHDIKVPTLYTVADAAGIRTANVGWPVTVNAPIDFNIAEGTQSEHTDAPPGKPLNPPDLREQIGIHPANPKQEDDPTKTAEAVALLRKFHPGLLLVHLTDLDEEEHGHSPFSPQANAAMEVLDGQIGQIAEAALAVDPRTRICIVSDHGFLRVDHKTNLNVLLAKAGLITLGPPTPGRKGPSVVGWQAEAWAAGGSNAIMLHDPNDKALIAKVKATLEAARADPANGIQTILTHEEIVKRGGFPMATFLVDYADGWDPGGNFDGPVVQDAPSTGMHGYLPDRPAMRSSFFIMGQGIAHGRDLGGVDMRQIAPTLAGLLDVKLPDAKQPALHVH